MPDVIHSQTSLRLRLCDRVNGAPQASQKRADLGLAAPQCGQVMRYLLHAYEFSQSSLAKTSDQFMAIAIHDKPLVGRSIADTTRRIYWLIMPITW